MLLALFDGFHYLCQYYFGFGFVIDADLDVLVSELQRLRETGKALQGALCQVFRLGAAREWGRVVFSRRGQILADFDSRADGRARRRERVPAARRECRRTRGRGVTGPGRRGAFLADGSGGPHVLRAEPGRQGVGGGVHVHALSDGVPGDGAAHARHLEAVDRFHAMPVHTALFTRSTNISSSELCVVLTSLNLTPGPTFAGIGLSGTF